ncbi:MAG: hypothetical protein HYU36_22050 [Planctomycetes bacterium]|nr:hypothetical protein [Planctomycetota bacterium]
METKSLFDSLTDQAISRWLDLFAVLSVLAGIAFGWVAGRVWKPSARYLVLGALAGLIGPALALSWHVVDARTSYWDYTYREQNPGRERLLWPVIGAGKLDSVRNLAALAVGFILAGLAAGFACGRVLNWVDRKYPAAAGTPMSPGASENVAKPPEGCGSGAVSDIPLKPET